MMLNMVLRRLNSTQSVIVQSGCCGGEPEWGAKELNDVVDPLRDALNILWPYERRDGMYEHLCLPLMHPVLVLNPGTRVPRWVKLYGARLTQPIPGIRCTEDTTKVVNDVVHLGSHLGDGTVMAFTSGSRGEQVAFRIDLQTGMPIGQLPVGIKVFDFAEVKAFRDDFRQQFGCSNAPVPPMGLRDGSCLELKAQYEKAVVAHFFK